jgi:hypothetical protein
MDDKKVKEEYVNLKKREEIEARRATRTLNLSAKLT